MQTRRNENLYIPSQHGRHDLVLRCEVKVQHGVSGLFNCGRCRRQVATFFACIVLVLPGGCHLVHLGGNEMWWGIWL